MVRCLHWHVSTTTEGALLNEADVSTEPTAARKDARLSGADADEGWAQGSQATPGQGSQAAHRVTNRLPRRERLTSRPAFQTLFQHGHRIDRPALVVLWRADDDRQRAGFAVSRQLRLAVERNRVRRRLRAAYVQARAGVPSGISLVIIGRPRCLRERFEVLVEQLRGALTAIGERRRSP
jgi:ribonuclease P protein component